MKKILAALALTPLVLALTPSPAHAAGVKVRDGTVHMYFNASPEPVKKCKKVLLGGETWVEGLHDHTGVRVNFYFKKAGTTSYVYKGHDNAAYNGRYSRYLKQCRSGTWKATLTFGDYSGLAARDYVKVR